MRLHNCPPRSCITCTVLHMLEVLLLACLSCILSMLRLVCTANGQPGYGCRCAWARRAAHPCVRQDSPQPELYRHARRHHRSPSQDVYHQQGHGFRAALQDLIPGITPSDDERVYLRLQELSDRARFGSCKRGQHIPYVSSCCPGVRLLFTYSFLRNPIVSVCVSLCSLFCLRPMIVCLLFHPRFDGLLLLR